MTLSEATAKLKSECDWSSDPALEEADITRLLAESLIGSTWLAETEYETGDVVFPTSNARTGLIYRCTYGGESNDEEPAWPTVGNISDGDATWEVYLPEPAGRNYPMLWDLGNATRNAWLLKAAKAAKYHSFGSDDQKFDVNQLIQHCNLMAGKFGAGCF